jgi:hypothetical protein
MFSFFISDACWFSGDAENSKQSSINIAAIHTPALAIGRENRESSFKMPIPKIQCFFTFQVYCWNFSILSFNYKGPLIDKRKKIACSMSNYFHSAKYKDSTSTSNTLSSYNFRII